MMRLGKFFRKHLGKYFLNSPSVTIDADQREGTEISEQSNQGSNQSSVHLDEQIAAPASSKSIKSTNTSESKFNNRKVIKCNRRAKKESLLKFASKTSSKSSSLSIKSTTNSHTSHQAERQSKEEVSLISDTKLQLSDSPKQGEENSESSQSQDLSISSNQSKNVQPIKSSTSDQLSLELDNKICLQREGSDPQSSKNIVLASESAIQSLTPTGQGTELKVDPNTVVTGITESVQAPFPSSQFDLTSENSSDPKRGTNAEIPIRITAPGFPVTSDSTPKRKPENVVESVHQSRQLTKTLTHAGQVKDMVTRSQHVPALTDLPSNSTSLRNYLESTSVRRPSSPRQDNSRNLVASNRHSSISAPQRPSLPRPEKSSGTNNSTIKGQPTPIRPSSPKKNSEISVPRVAAKDTAVYPQNDENNQETVEKTPAKSSTLDEDVSLVSFVEVSDSTKEVIESAMRNFGMKELTTEGYWNVRWSDNGVSIQVCQKLQKYQRINRFPVSGLLMTKNILAKNTTKMKQIFPEEYDFVPETWCLSGEVSKVELYARAHDRDCFIVKPNDGSSGKGIIITRNIAKLKMCDRMVCQVYIRKPFLIDGYKFDLRIYTLITSCLPLRLFVYNEGLARFATELYEEPNQNNESNRYMHLTNYAVNKRSPSYIVDETKGTLRRLTTINKWLVRHNIDAKKVWESMDDAIVKTIIAFLPALRHNYRVSFPEQTNSNSCFQILGFDIIFDEDLKPYVLEVNDSPSFKADVPLDKEMTDSLIRDTFNILHLNENNRSKVLMEEKRQSRMRLLSSSQNRTAMYREKEQNERLLTQSRAEWENSHMGNYRKVFPNEQKMKHYKKFIRASQDIFINKP